MSWWNRRTLFYREMELESSEPGHQIGKEQPSHCGVVAVNDGHNAWVCARCGAFVQQILRVSEMVPK